jgi:plastocyanin
VGCVKKTAPDKSLAPKAPIANRIEKAYDAGREEPMQARVRVTSFLVVVGCVLVLWFVLNANAEPPIFQPVEQGPARMDDRSILITAQGLSEARIIIDTGVTVTWVNQTDRKQTLVNAPYQVYLPLLMTGSQVQACTAMKRAAVGVVRGGPVQPAWGGDIEPGGSYSHTFSTSGDYRYYLAGHPTGSGQVLVRAPDAETSTPTITASPTSERSVFVDGCVWNDVNGNGMVDPFEMGIGEVAIELWQLNLPGGAQHVYAAATTTGNGSYEMHNSCQVPLCDAVTKYEVRVVATNFRPGGILNVYTPTTGDIVGQLGTDGYVRIALWGQGVYSDKNFGFRIGGTPGPTVMAQPSSTPTATPTTPCRGSAPGCVTESE